MRTITDRVIDSPDTDCANGTVRWSPAKSLWFSAMALGWIIGGVAFFSWSAVAIFLGLCAVILCRGSFAWHAPKTHS